MTGMSRTTFEIMSNPQRIIMYSVHESFKYNDTSLRNVQLTNRSTDVSL